MNSTMTENVYGGKEWRNANGELHREDGPAIEAPNVYKCWYRNGRLHREDGPAIEWANGYKGWWRDGKLRREDSP